MSSCARVTCPRPTSPHELQEFVAARLASYKRPRWVEFLPELPKTATGKIQRFKLRRLAGVLSSDLRNPLKIIPSRRDSALPLRFPAA